MRFVVATVPPGGGPGELSQHGLRNLPALVHGGEALDTLEEMVEYIEALDREGLEDMGSLEEQVEMVDYKQTCLPGPGAAAVTR